MLSSTTPLRSITTMSSDDSPSLARISAPEVEPERQHAMHVGRAGDGQRREIKRHLADIADLVDLEAVTRRGLRQEMLGFLVGREVAPLAELADRRAVEADERPRMEPCRFAERRLVQRAADRLRIGRHRRDVAEAGEEGARLADEAVVPGDDLAGDFQHAKLGRLDQRRALRRRLLEQERGGREQQQSEEERGAHPQAEAQMAHLVEQPAFPKRRAWPCGEC